APDLLDLVLVDPVSHPWIDPFGNRAAERLEHASGLVHPIERNMRIGVAATEENRGAGELAGVVTRRAFRPDQTTAQTDYRAIAARVPRRILEGETGALRKSEQCDALRLKALAAEPAQQRVQHL